MKNGLNLSSIIILFLKYLFFLKKIIIKINLISLSFSLGKDKINHKYSPQAKKKNELNYYR